MVGTTWTLFNFGSALPGFQQLMFRLYSWNVTQLIVRSLSPNLHRPALGSSLMAQFRMSSVGLLLSLRMHTAPLGPPRFNFPLDPCSRALMLSLWTFGGPSLTSGVPGLGSGYHCHGLTGSSSDALGHRLAMSTHFSFLHSAVDLGCHGTWTSDPIVVGTKPSGHCRE